MIVHACFYGEVFPLMAPADDDSEHFASSRITLHHRFTAVFPENVVLLNNVESTGLMMPGALITTAVHELTRRSIVADPRCPVWRAPLT
jgi:hypothetical protein